APAGSQASVRPPKLEFGCAACRPPVSLAAVRVLRLAKRPPHHREDREIFAAACVFRAPPIATVERISSNGSFRPAADIAPYSITSSARASSVGGTVRLSAFAVLRLNAK